MATYRKRKLTLKERLENFIKGIARKILSEEIENYEMYRRAYPIERFTALEKELEEVNDKAKKKEAKLQRQIDLLKRTIEYIKEENNKK